MFPWLNKNRNDQLHTYTPARQRALARRTYTLGAIAIALVLLALAQFGEDGLATLFRLQTKEAELAQEVQQLDKANSELDQRLQGLATDPSVLEKMAREHNMKRPDEEVLTVIPAEKAAAADKP